MVNSNAGVVSIKLIAIEQAARDARQRAREVEVSLHSARAQRDGLRQAVVEAHASGEAKRVKEAEKRLADHDELLSREAMRAEGYKLAATRAEQDVPRFVAANLAALLDEHAAGAEQAAENLSETLSGLYRALVEYEQAGAVSDGLCQRGGRADLRVPLLGQNVVDLIRQARRLSESVEIPAPLPVPPAEIKLMQADKESGRFVERIV